MNFECRSKNCVCNTPSRKRTIMQQDADLKVVRPTIHYQHYLSLVDCACLASDEWPFLFGSLTNANA